MSTAVFWVLFLGTAAVILLVQRWKAGQEAEERARVEAERKQRDKEFWSAAKKVRAKVVSACGTGERYNLMPVIDFTLKIESPDGPYEVNVKQAIEDLDLHRISPGKVVSVWIDPSKRDRVELVDANTSATLDEADKMLEEGDEMMAKGDAALRDDE